MGEVRGGRGGRWGAVVETARGHTFAALAVRVEELLDESFGAARRRSLDHGRRRRHDRQPARLQLLDRRAKDQG